MWKASIKISDRKAHAITPIFRPKKGKIEGGSQHLNHVTPRVDRLIGQSLPTDREEHLERGDGDSKFIKKRPNWNIKDEGPDLASNQHGTQWYTAGISKQPGGHWKLE